MLRDVWSKVKNTGPAHVRLASVLIVGGVSTIVPGIRSLVVAFTKTVLGVQTPEIPYWVGLILVGTGILVLVLGYYRRDFLGRRLLTQLAFKINYADNTKKIHRLPADASIRIGRGDDNDLIIKDAYVSRHHCIVRVRNDYVEVNDLASSNVTKINGVSARTGVVGVNESLILGTTKLVVVRMN